MDKKRGGDPSLFLFSFSLKLPLDMHPDHRVKTISFVGAGNVGWHLAIALKNAGFRVEFILSRNQERASELAARTGAMNVRRLDQVRSWPDLLILCLPDDALPGIAAQLRNISSLVVHTAGSASMRILEGCRGGYGVMYPLQTFTRERSMDYQVIPFLLEADSDASRKKLEFVASKISGNITIADSALRLKIHVAAVFACNFSNHMVSLAWKLLIEDGVDPAILQPLLDETREKQKQMSPMEAQTGPARRNDKGTMERHLDLLREHPEMQDIYKILSRSLLQMYK